MKPAYKVRLLCRQCGSTDTVLHRVEDYQMVTPDGLVEVHGAMIFDCGCGYWEILMGKPAHFIGSGDTSPG